MGLKNEIKLNKKYTALTVLTALLVYAAYWINFSNLPELSNILWTGVMIILSVMLFKNINKEKSIEILFYYAVLSLFLVPVAFLSMAFDLQVILLIALNILLNLIMAYGLKRKAKWGLYFTLVLFALSAISMTALLIAYFRIIEGTFQGWVVMVKNASIILFTVISFACLVNNRKCFGRKKA